MIKKLKNSEIITIINELNKGDIDSKQMPMSFLWALKVNTNKLIEVLKLYEESRNDLVKMFSTDEKSVEVIDKNGLVNRNIKPEFKDEWVKQNLELLNQETEFDFTTVNIDSIKDVTMTPLEFDIISRFMFEI